MRRGWLSWWALVVLIVLLLIVIIVKITQNKPAAQITATPIGTSAVQTEFAPMVGRIHVHDIQGAGHRSPLEDEQIAGLVCVVTAKTGDGFYCQEPEPDENDATSEGIFVRFFQTNRLDVGQQVVVSGLVDEFYTGGLGSNDLPITMIIDANVEFSNLLMEPIEAVYIGDGGRVIPTRIIDDDDLKVFDPENDGIDFYESLEGMLVGINAGRIVQSTNSYRETVIVPECADCGPYTANGGIYIKEDDQNPERLIIDDSLASISHKSYGEFLASDVIGVMSYGYENYRLLPLKDFKVNEATTSESTRETSEEALRIATYNVLNLAPDELSDRFPGIAAQIVKDLGSPDILNLTEVQDSSGILNDGITDAEETVSRLLEEISKAGGPAYRYVYVTPIDNMDGGVVGGNIRNVLLFRPDKGITIDTTAFTGQPEARIISVGGMPALQSNPSVLSPKSSAFRNSRKPLVVELSVNGEKVFLISAHLNSKGPDQGLFGLMQPPQTPSESQRINQARLIASFLKSIFELDANANVIVLGDFNDFDFSEPLKLLQGAGIISSTAYLDESERYSFVHQGNSQLIDNIYVTSNLYSRITFVKIYHVNTALPYKYQMSDHDAVLIEITN